MVPFDEQSQKKLRVSKEVAAIRNFPYERLQEFMSPLAYEGASSSSNADVQMQTSPQDDPSGAVPAQADKSVEPDGDVPMAAAETSGHTPLVPPKQESCESDVKK